MFINYRKSHGIEYAYLEHSYRDENKVVQKGGKYLGRVLDKKRNVFRSRALGVFTYDINTNEYGQAPEEFTIIKQRDKKCDKELKILTFGDSYFLNQIIASTGIKSCIEAINSPYQELLLTMICYYIMRQASNSNAQVWYEGNYISELYPGANPSSQRISRMMNSVGSEESYRNFFASYFEHIKDCGTKGLNIMVDSTGLPNAIHFPLTAVSNHNGKISQEVRLIYVVDNNTGLPVYLRYIPGNVIDISTLKITIAELKEQGVDVNCAVLDAGYCGNDNLKALLDSNIAFVTRLKENLSLYKQIYQEHIDELKDHKHVVKYNNRVLLIKRIACNFQGYGVYVYLCKDLAQQSIEQFREIDNLSASKDDDIESYTRFIANIDRLGVFMLISSLEIEEKKILDTYYTRQQIEQMFDVSKNYCKLLPLAVHSESTFRGHILICFIATVLVRKIMKMLSGNKQKLTVERALMSLENIKCKVFDQAIIAQEFSKKSADTLKLCQVPLPEVRLPRAKL